MVSEPDDGSSKVFRNVGILPRHYIMFHPEDHDLKLRRPEISNLATNNTLI